MQIETQRQIVHMAFGALPFLLVNAPMSVIWFVLSLLLLITTFVVPRLALSRFVLRPKDIQRGIAWGGITYFGSLLLLSIIAPWHIVALAWVILAFGDGAATFIGLSVGGRRLPWNQNKTWAGFVSFFLASAVGAGSLLVALGFVFPTLPLIIVIVLLAALGAGVESSTLPIDDNISIPVITVIFASLLL